MSSKIAKSSGFTLIEMLIACTIFIIVAAQIVVVFTGINRTVQTTMAEMEFALAARQLRERLLFKATPDEEDRYYAGLLSASDVTVDYSAITAKLPYVDSTGNADTDSNNITDGRTAKLGIGSKWNSTRQQNDMMIEDKYNNYAKLWLFTSGISFGYDYNQWNDSNHEGTGFADREAFAESDGKNYYLNLRYEANGVVHRERIAIPIFGKEQ